MSLHIFSAVKKEKHWGRFFVNGWYDNNGIIIGYCAFGSLNDFVQCFPFFYNYPHSLSTCILVDVIFFLNNCLIYLLGFHCRYVHWHHMLGLYSQIGWIKTFFSGLELGHFGRTKLSCSSKWDGYIPTEHQEWFLIQRQSPASTGTGLVGVRF